MKAGDRVISVPLAAIEPFAEQPRSEFDQGKLFDLASSLRELGQQEPAKARELAPGRYQLIDGERRWRALKMIGAESMLVIVREVADVDEQFVRAIVANAAREDLTPSESARAVARVAAMPAYRDLPPVERDRRIGALFGRSWGWARDMLMISTIAPEAQALVDEKRLSSDAAKDLAAIPSHRRQAELAERIAERKIPSRAASKLIADAAKLEGVPDRNRFRGPTPAANPRAKLLREFLQRIEQTAELVLDFKNRELEEIYRTRPDDRATAIDMLRSAIGALEQLEEALERIGGGT